MPRDRSYRMLTREIGTGHRFLAPVALLKIRQGLSHGPPLRARDFVQRGRIFDLCLHRLHEGFRAQVDLALQSRPHAGQVGAFGALRVAPCRKHGVRNMLMQDMTPAPCLMQDLTPVPEQLQNIGNNATLVRSFFGSPSVAYISDL